MKKTLHFFLQLALLSPCFAQTTGEQVSFFTRSRFAYSGIVTEVNKDSFKVQFEPIGISLSLPAEFYSPKNADVRIGNNSINGTGDRIETQLKQEAVAIINNVFKECTYPENRPDQSCFRYCELRGYNLYFFYTSRGYDLTSTDYHIMKIDLTSFSQKSPFSSAGLLEFGKGRDNYPVVEISKHTNSPSYDENQFRGEASWDNQPQFMTDLPLYFLNKRHPSYRNAAEQLHDLFLFLCDSSKRSKK